MANRLLLQTLVKFRDEIKSGSAKVQDVVTDYFNSTGKQPTADERTIILNEFNEFAPSNVEDLSVIRTENLRTSPDSQTPFTDKLKQQNPDVELRGDETFGELTEKLGKPKDQGLGSLYPKGKTREIFDASNAERDDLAGFMREMRKAGIKNEDVMNVAKMTDVAQGKRAATTLARAADMGADTKIKQEFLSELDETIMDKGPRFFQEEYQGYDSYDALLKNKGREVRTAIFDDLEALGVEEDKASSIIDFANDVARRNPNQPEAFLESIKQDIELEGIKYDLSFWENYISKTLELSAKPATRFADGGRINFRTGGPTSIGNLQGIIGADLVSPSLGSLGGMEEEDEFADIRGQTAGLGIVSGLKGLGLLGDYFINQGRAKIANRGLDVALKNTKQKQIREAVEAAAAARVAAVADINRNLNLGGYQSDFAQDDDFMSGSGTAAEMGSFRDGGLASMFVRRR